VALLTASSGLGCAPPVAATPYPSEPPPMGDERTETDEDPAPGVVRYFDRSVDLTPFLEGFPYTRFMADLEQGKLYFLHTQERYTLRVADLAADGSVDLESAKDVGNEDWSKRSLWSVHHHASSGSLWMHADAANDEKMNLWRMSLADGAKPQQISHADYVYSYGFNEQESSIAYLARSGTKAPFSTCLRVLELDGGEPGEDREILCDSGDLSFTWGTPRFSPDGRVVFFNAQIDGDRRRVQLVSVDLAKKKLEVVTDRKRERSSPSTLEGWVADDLLLYTSNEDGYRNLYSYSLRKKKTRQLTRFREDVSGAVLTDAGVFLAHGSPAGTTLELVDPKSGASLARGGVAGRVGILDGHGKRAMWTHQAPDVVFEANSSEAVASEGGLQFSNKRVLELPAKLADQLVQCKATAVKIPTFDRELHAFLLEPRQPVAREHQLAMVRSFYGGSNTYTRYDHVMCAAGVTIVSASVRGSSGFGKEFAALNDGDLGGDEIVDLFHVARWLEARQALPPERIGVYGRSHGGYATMRAMTFPPETNQRNDNYAFGFGLAEAGFSDIEAFHGATNIPDWVVLEAGDPAVPADLEKIRDRSPIHHVDLLAAPIFLLHGSNDWRVPVEGSRAFVERARAAGKRVTYFEVEGQGHHVEGLERLVDSYQARLDYLMALFDGEGGA
jgi:dipeptidyl aminopeptidase/acylaminoacyl peptidase